MKRIIYVDILISLNLFITYFLLLGTGKFLNLSIRRSRLIFASLAGGISALTVFLPEMPASLALIIKILLSAIILFLAFGYPSFKIFAKATAVFYMETLVFLGIAFLLWYFISPPGLWMKNGAIYINISPLFLAIATIISYGAFRLMSRLSGKSVMKKAFYSVLIESQGKQLKIKAKVDTGNTLVEPFSSLPVIVAEYKHVKSIIPSDFCLNENSDCSYSFSKNFRVIPFRTISGQGALPAFRPEKLYIEEPGKRVQKEAYLAVCQKGMLPGEYQALINSELID